MEIQHFSAIIRDSTAFEIALTWDGESFSPGSGWVLMASVKKRRGDPDSASVFQKTSGAGITVTGSTATLTTVPDDSDGMHPRTLYGDIRAQSITTDERRTVARYDIEYDQDLSQETSTSVDVITTETPLPFGGGEWGSITGTLSDQEDLAAALALKQPIDADLTAYASASDAAARRSLIGAEALESVIITNTANRTLTLPDSGAYIRFTNIGPITITVPTEATTPFPIGTKIHLRRDSTAGQIAISNAGVTINNSTIIGAIIPGGNASLIKIASNIWDAVGTPAELTATIILANTGATTEDAGALGINSSGQVVIHDNDRVGDELHYMLDSSIRKPFFATALAAALTNTQSDILLATFPLSSTSTTSGSLLRVSGRLVFDWTLPAGGRPDYVWIELDSEGQVPGGGFSMYIRSVDHPTLCLGDDDSGVIDFDLIIRLSPSGSVWSMTPYHEGPSGFFRKNNSGTITNTAEWKPSGDLGAFGACSGVIADANTIRVYLISYDESASVTSGMKIRGEIGIEKIGAV